MGARMTVPHVDALYVYPIKALRGVRVESARVTARGFEADRRWMLVDEAGEFVTQRSLPELATFEVELGEHLIRVSRADVGAVEVPRIGAAEASMPVRVWDSAVRAAPAAPEIDRYFSEALGRPLRLVYMPESVRRAVSPKRVPEGAIVGFADGYPYLVISRSAVELVGARAGRTLSAERFRPNLVLGGVAPHAEDEWAGFEVGGVRFSCVKPCDRCVVITRDPRTGAADTEPLATLADYRRRDGAVWFGQNLVARGEGEIRVGAEVLALPAPTPP